MSGIECSFSYDPQPAEAWQVVADAGEVARAADDVGIDANAQRPSDMDDEASVSYPTAICADGAAFLGLLALLDERGVPFRLYRTLDDPEARAHYRLHVFPEPGSETRMILKTFHPMAAYRVRDMQSAIRHALNQIAAQATLQNFRDYV